VANFFLDNDDIQFLFHHLDLAGLAGIQEDGFARKDNGDADYIPEDAEVAVDNYRRLRESGGAR
jgi:hypothetical protein